VASYTQESPAVVKAPTKRVRIRWVFIALIVCAGIVNYIDRNTLSIGNTTIAADLDLNTIEMGLLLSAFSWPYAIANLPAGYLVDKYGAKTMFAWAAALWSIVTMLTALVRNFPLFYAARVALGITESPFFTSGLKVSERWFAKDERSLPISIINTGSQIANAIAPPLLTFLLLTMSWQGMFLIVGAFGLLVAAVWVKVYRDPTHPEEIVIKGAEAEQEPATTETASWFSLLKQPNTWFMVLGAFGIFYTVWVYLTWLPSYLQTSRGFSLKEIGWVASLPFLCGIFGVLTGGYLSTRLIKRGLQTITARKIPIVGGAVLAAASVLPVAYIDNTLLIIILLCLGYFAAQVPIGVIWTLASDLAEKHQVASLGAIQNFGGFVGAAAAPIVTGIILNATNGNFSLVFLVGGILLLVGAASYGFFVKDRRKPELTPACG
jgi:predicted MFS family arabinose efflux permease